MRPGMISKIVTALVVMILINQNADAAALETRSITLNPGWNSVFLDVQPENKAPSSVFDNLVSGSSVWTWTDKQSRVEFIKSPDEGLWNQPGWSVYVHDPSKAFLTNLHAVFAGRAYLIHLKGEESRLISITGCPVVKETKWVQDSFNLAGFYVNRDAISFETYFAPSKAHKNQAVYRLGDNGEWVFIDDLKTTMINPGEAYWVYCEGPSVYQGSLDISLPSLDGINFSKSVERQTLKLKNLSSQSKTITFNLQPRDLILTYRHWDEAANGFKWSDLETLSGLLLEPGASETIKLVIRREAMSQGEAGSVLKITDDAGILASIPVWVDKELTSSAPASKGSGSKAALSKSAAKSADDILPGLWVGTASINKVSMVNQREADFYFDMQITGEKKGAELIEKNASWKYLVANPVNNEWKNSKSFDDSGWSDSKITSLPSEVSGTVYFRKIFTLPDSPDAVQRKYTDYSFSLLADDGAAVYLNGRLIHKENLELIAPQSLASIEVTGSAENEYSVFSIPASFISQGENLLAVVVHQKTDADNEDFGFDLALKAVIKDIILPFQAEAWHFYDKADSPSPDGDGNTWANPEYTESDLWREAKSPFTFGNGDTSPEHLNNAAHAIYFRRAFKLSGLSEYSSFDVSFYYDDGAVLYVNGYSGYPKYRLNMPSEGITDYNTPPVSVRRATEESTMETISLKGLLEGENTIAVEVHQHASELGGGSTGESNPVSTGYPLDLRLLLHVDANGTTRLLKEVILMKDPAYEDTGRLVLLTDHKKIPDCEGVAWRDGVKVSRRLCSVGFDFEETDTDNPGTMLMEKNGNTLSCELSLPGEYPTNPFLHKYHPDHDNRDSRYKNSLGQGDSAESFSVNRTVSINLNTDWENPDDETKPPGWGLTVLEGAYNEILSGLHKNNISVTGELRLNRVSDVDVLNP